MRARKTFAARQALDVPADVLARAAHAGELAVQRVVVLQMLEQQPPHLGHQRRRQVRAGGQEMRDLAEDPGPALRRPADHDGVGPGRFENVPCLLGGGDVAVGHHRHPHRGFHGGDGVVFGLAAIALLAGAAVHGQHLHAGVLESARQLHRVLVGLAPAGAHLERHRNAMRLASADHGCGDRDRQRLVLHQRRARPFAADLLGGAAHVDVDDLGTAIDVVGGGFRHHGGVGASDLHRDRTGLALVVGAARGLQAVPQLAPRRDHLTDGIARSEPAAQLAERPVGHAGHRRHEQVVRQKVRADVHAVRDDAAEK